MLAKSESRTSPVIATTRVSTSGRTALTAHCPSGPGRIS